MLNAWVNRMLRRVVVLVVAVVVAGCGAAGPGEGEKPERTLITFSHGKLPGPAATLTRLLRDFEAAHPTLRVVEQVLPASSDEQHQFYLLNLEGGVRRLDVIAIDIIWVQEFARAGWLRSLREGPSAAARQEFLPNTLRAAIFGDRLYALPWFIDVGVLYYRSDLLAKYGFEPPRTFPELARQARLILDREHDPHLYGFVWQGKQYEGLVCNVLEYIWANGGAVLNAAGAPSLASAAALEAARFVHALIYESGVSPPLVSMADEEVSRRIFSAGRAVFHRNWPYAWSIFQAAGSPVWGKVGVRALPAFAGGDSASTLGGWLLAINERSAHPEAARKLVEFLTGRRAQRALTLGNGLRPTRRSLYHDPDLLNRQPLLEALRPIIARARPRPVTPFYMMVSQILQSAFSAVVADQASPDEAFRQADAQLSRVLAADLR